MQCQEIMRDPVITCRNDETVRDCAQLMLEHKVGFIPVVDCEKQIVGVITDRDLALRVVAANLPPYVKVETVMSKPVICCELKNSLEDAENKMMKHRKSRIVVVNQDGGCEGVISLADIVQEDSDKRVVTVMKGVTGREVRSQW